MNTVQRIKQYIDLKGITTQKFEQQVGYSNGAFATQLKNNKTIGSDKLENILNTYTDINPSWLIIGDGEMFKKDIAKSNLIPLYDSVATLSMTSSDMSPVSEPAEYIDAGDWFRDATAAMRVHGDSMFPDYRSGSIVALKEIFNKEVILYGEDYVFESEEYRALKRLQKGKSKEFVLACSSNTERWEDGSEKGRIIHEPVEIHRDEIRRLFLVLGAVRRNHSSRIVYNSRK